MRSISQFILFRSWSFDVKVIVRVVWKVGGEGRMSRWFERDFPDVSLTNETVQTSKHDLFVFKENGLWDVGHSNKAFRNCTVVDEIVSVHNGEILTYPRVYDNEHSALFSCILLQDDGWTEVLG
jgi:hypothetical protein